MTKGAFLVEANGLEHHVLEWGPASGRPVFLIHGFMDAAATWDRVAEPLAAAGLRVLAPDMRGFGEGPRTPRGSYYHFADYVADVAALIDVLSPAEPIALVGHSMGGTIATLYAGTYPERVARLANLEGVGPPDNEPQSGPVRMRRWIDDLRKLEAPPAMSFDDARRRLAASHPRVSAEAIDRLVPQLVQEVEGGVTWRFDPLHRTTSPFPFFAAVFVEFAKLVSCPVLYVSGGPQGYHVPDEEARLAGFRDCRQATIPEAGHMMHWTKPAELGAALVRFFE